MIFEMCTCDYPQENTNVLVSIGNMSLNIKVFLDEVCRRPLISSCLHVLIYNIEHSISSYFNHRFVYFINH